MLRFIEDKWCDLVGLLLLFGGIAVAAFLPSCRTLGESAFAAGLLALKLQGSAAGK